MHQDSHEKSNYVATTRVHATWSKAIMTAKRGTKDLSMRMCSVRNSPIQLTGEFD